MAINTATKRYTISNMTLPWRMVGTVPDNTTSNANRVADGYLYAMAASAVATATFICMKNISGTAIYATSTFSEIKASVSGAVTYATATWKCK